MSRIEGIAAKGPAPFGKHDTVMLQDLIIRIDRALVTLHKPIGTTQLIRLMLSQPTDDQMKNLVAWLRLARTTDDLNGYFTQGKPAAGTFGKPRILWLLTADKRSDIEDYQAMNEPD